MPDALSFWHRLGRSAVVWSWFFNFLRLSAGVILLPLLLKKLTEEDLGMYYVFLRLIALVPIIDFGFSVSVGRSVSYAMGGARTLLAQGVQLEPSDGSPNRTLLWELLSTSRKLYGLMGLAALLLLGVWGTWTVGMTVEQTANPSLTWVAWGASLVAAIYQLYSGWWNTYLRGANQVVSAARYAVLGYAVQLALACGLLLKGGGLLSVPIGMIAGSLIQQTLSRRACLRLVGERPPDLQPDGWALVRVLWPNSWRVGLQLLGGYLGVSLPSLLFASQFGLALFAPYGISLQIMSICSGMAMVWMQVKWPQVGQCRARQDLEALRRLLWPRFWLQNLTFVLLALGAITVGPLLLEWIGSGKALLAVPLLSLLALATLLELQFIFWGTLLSTENRVPYLKASLLTQLASFLIFLGLSRGLQIDYLSLIIAPLVAGCAYNYWHWPRQGARSIGTTWSRFIIRKPEDRTRAQEQGKDAPLTGATPPPAEDGNN